MIYLIDIGNSRLKWATLTDNIIHFQKAISYTETSLDEVTKQLWLNKKKPDRVLVANVAGERVAKQLDTWCQHYWKQNAIFVRTTKKMLGVTNAYAEYKQLGIDRWLNIIAAWNHYHDAIFVIDCGTAITIDVVNKAGERLGGMIAPGMELLTTSLTQCAQIPSLSLTPEDYLATPIALGTNTRECIISGCYNMAAAFIEQFTQKFSQKFTCILTGGNAELFLPLLDKHPCHHKPYLVFEGLGLLALNNNHESPAKSYCQVHEN